MFWKIFSFEIGYQLRRPAVWLYFFATTALLTLLIKEIADDAKSSDDFLLNAPLIIAEITVYANRLGLFLIAALTGGGIMRDIQAGMHSLVYTTGVRKSIYLGADFLAILSVAAALILLSVPLSIITGGFILDLGPESIGTFSPAAYLNAGLLFNLPNTFIFAAFLYAMVLTGRNTGAGFAGALLLFMFSIFNMELFGENWNLVKLMDPSGMSVLEALTRSLPPVMKNTAGINPDAYLIGNRILWCGLAIATGLFAYSGFQLSHYTSGFICKRKIESETSGAMQSISAESLTVTKTFDVTAKMQQVWRLGMRYYYETLKSPSVLVIPAIAIYSFILIPNLSEGPMGVSILPVTERMVFFLDHSALRIVVTMVIIIFAGQFAWRERDARLNDMWDTLPVSGGIMMTGKFLGLSLILISLQLALILSGICVQFIKGYDQPDVALYLRSVLGFQLADHLLFAAVALSIHTIINQKYIAHLVAILFYFVILLSGRFGIEHKLLIFGSDTGTGNSIFYDQAAFLLPWISFKLYWTGWALLIAAFAVQLWPRGRDNTGKFRLIRIKYLIIGKGQNYYALIVSTVLIVAAGGFIFYNTNILNNYQTQKEITIQKADYEMLYGKYKSIPQPALTQVDLLVEFYPEDRQALIKGTYQMKNNSDQAVNTIHIDAGADVETSGIRFSRKSRTTLSDVDQGYFIFLLDEALQPGDSIQMNYTIRFNQEGFSNKGIRTEVMSNGTWFSNSEWLPAVGYRSDREITDAATRKEYGLAKRDALPPASDQSALMNQKGRERVYFKATIGTSATQIALAPGSLIKTLMKGDRKYFQYKTDSPINNAYYIYSAGYQEHNSRVDDIDIQVFNHPRNSGNLESIQSGTKAALEYYTRNFGPYPHKQLKLVEYPDPGTGGISLPGSIGYSTNLGLLDNDTKGEGFNLPFAVTAHEIAHQWWGAQLSPARVEGAPFMSESLAWYSALGAVERVEGPEHLRKLLDAMRNDYLRPQSFAGVPLLRTADPFLAYRKGPLAMYALREYIGEDKVNAALRNLISQFKSHKPPFATSLDFYREIRSVTPDSLHYLLRDLFEKNTIWKLETKQALVKRAGKDHWSVTLEVSAQKTEVDAEGLEKELPMNDLIEIGVFGEGKNNNKLYLQKHRIHQGLNYIRITVNEKPEEAGIDPRHLLIDTQISDNTRRIDVN